MRIGISTSAALLFLSAVSPHLHLVTGFSTHHSSGALFSSSPATLIGSSLFSVPVPAAPNGFHSALDCRLFSSTNAEDIKISTSALDQAKSASTNVFGDEGVDVLEFELKHHKPLGCTAEESLVEGKDGAKHVFVSKVNAEGNAAKGGIKEGDVILAVTGSFEDVMVVAGLGLGKVQPLIAGHPEDEPISIFVARGTDVQSEHDTALVDICTFNEGLDSQIEECIISMNTYDYGFEEDEPTVECGDDDSECLIDQMYGSWGDEMSEFTEQADVDDGATDEQPVKKPAPWSSRSSPSGTFVRDPKTGEMRNIDA
uniref:PDZ domain-containing protein n=1 Tax=Minutocellus polymorphus TaxID=265543 RepID=A0A7S0FIA4_9STRA|mmetsp:Transcript_12037/g.20072  ORF Transcript_12037/g.20072 Transcript_12037/m.20072 type:complete len:313 (+) Transcript_12037:113-1051(+)|eukprot:CAMPEP_0197726268 /NCGR_PEP_ID=MMETSP1434-20131217/14646_1 /TAXON_ID=265543 /ORGANISM="Minutocellus polymorphus, Strain CCMP3303" /LENGTH=312 /DNA_ID=CAMNT_0043312149 /DNA_START=113 /DNA_END=1051 /DNA_ORIENTATION=+